MYLYRSSEYWHSSFTFTRRHASNCTLPDEIRIRRHLFVFHRRVAQGLVRVFVAGDWLTTFRIYESSRRRILETGVRVEGELVIDWNGKLFGVSNCLQGDPKLRYCKERVNIVEPWCYSLYRLCRKECLIERKRFFVSNVIFVAYIDPEYLNVI